MANPDHYIYAIGDGEYVKVGFATSVRRRLAALQGANPRQLYVLREILVPQWKNSTSNMVSAKNHERALHELLSQFRVRGEWFAEPESVLFQFDWYWQVDCRVAA